MKRPALFDQIKKQYHAHSKARRELIAVSNDALSKSKRAIFALHRDDVKHAQELLVQAGKQFGQIESSFKKFSELKEEGAYRAALEEYAEAQLFLGYLASKMIVKIDARASEPSIYLAGLSDATGELVRYATRQVTLGHPEVVAEVEVVVRLVIEFILDLDLTGYQRNKFDQAKKNLSRLEQMTYDLAIRNQV